MRIVQTAISMALFSLLFQNSDYTLAQKENSRWYPYGGIINAERFKTGILKKPIDFTEAIFDSVLFDSIAYFEEARFKRTANFENSRFKKHALFWKAQFDSAANFQFAEFDSAAIFANCRFANEANLMAVKFNNSSVIFDSSLFDGDAHFLFTRFKPEASFTAAQFNLGASFASAQFNNSANFTGAAFKRVAFFLQTRFDSSLTFNNVRCNGVAYFRQARFDRSSFNDTHFHSQVSFDSAQFGAEVFFVKTCFDSLASFKKATFYKGVFEADSYFKSVAFFEGAKFYSTVSFVGSVFSNDVDFSDATFKKNVEFFNVKFLKSADFRAAEFDGSVTLDFSFSTIGDVIYVGTVTSREIPRFDFSKAEFLDAGREVLPADATEKISGKVVKLPGAKIVLTGPVDLRIQLEKFDLLVLPYKYDYYTKKDIISTLKEISFKGDNYKAERFELDHLFATSTAFQKKSSRFEEYSYFNPFLWLQLVYYITMELGFKPFKLVLHMILIVMTYAFFYMQRMPVRVYEYLHQDSGHKVTQNTNKKRTQGISREFIDLFVDCVYFSAVVFFSFRLRRDLITFFSGREKKIVVVEWLLGLISYIAFLLFSKSGSIIHQLRNLLFG
jgi:hypothetical protein